MLTVKKLVDLLEEYERLSCIGELRLELLSNEGITLYNMDTGNEVTGCDNIQSMETYLESSIEYYKQ